MDELAPFTSYMEHLTNSQTKEYEEKGVTSDQKGLLLPNGTSV